MLAVIGEILCRAGTALYFNLSRDQALMFNGTDLVISGLANVIFKEKLSPIVSGLISRTIGCVAAFALTTHFAGPMLPIVAVATSVSALAVRALLSII